MEPKDQKNGFSQIINDQLPFLFQEMHSYLKARQQFPILNCQRLIKLIRISCSFLLDPRSRFSLFTDRVGNNWFQFELSGHDADGNKINVSFYDGFQNFITNALSDLAACIDQDCFEDLVGLLDSFIQHPEIDIQLKFAVINSEIIALQQVYEFYFQDAPELMQEQFINVRKDFIYECIRSRNNGNQNNLADVELESLYGVFEFYLSWQIKSFIRKNKYIDIMDLLVSELEKCKDSVLGTNIIWNMIIYNNQFLIKSKHTLEQTVADFYHIIQDEKRELIEDALDFSPADIDMKDYTVELGSYELNNVDFSKVQTIIFATIPLKAKEPYIRFELNKDTFLEFKTITNPLEDPIFNFYYELKLNINGMPLAILSEALYDEDTATLLVITLNAFYHPDFEIVSNQIVHTSFSETEALLGRKYYPHKDKIITLLRSLMNSNPQEFPLEISIEDININLISNYVVNYIDENSKSFFHKIYSITNPDSFNKIRTQYLDKVSKINLGEKFLSTRELSIESHIGSSKSLCDFVYKVMELTVKKPIELEGVYRYLWEDRSLMTKPCTEPNAQPLIKSHMRPILETKGIQISREVKAANGSLDYLCSYTQKDKLFKIGVELKNAHHPDLLHGLIKQLPAYLEGEGTQDAIFVVLWYKNHNHPYPSKYGTIGELYTDLSENCPNSYRIRVMVIDCTQQAPPSKLS